MRKLILEQIANMLIIIVMVSAIACAIYIIEVCECPASIYKSGDTIDNKYIIETSINDTQLYAHIPDDNSVLLITVKAKPSIWVSIFSATGDMEDMKDYIIIEKIEEVSYEQNQN